MTTTVGGDHQGAHSHRPADHKVGKNGEEERDDRVNAKDRDKDEPRPIWFYGFGREWHDHGFIPTFAERTMLGGVQVTLFPAGD
jgi:hypothetical protein